LQPELLGKHQAYCKEKLKTDDPRPLYLVFHGGSGSTKKEIATALANGVVKVRMLRPECIMCIYLDRLN
jgi:fructose-bisphosphate aldolase class II